MMLLQWISLKIQDPDTREETEELVVAFIGSKGRTILAPIYACANEPFL